MKEIDELEALGYAFSIKDDDILYHCDLDHPDPVIVRLLFEALSRKRMRR